MTLTVMFNAYKLLIIIGNVVKPRRFTRKSSAIIRSKLSAFTDDMLCSYDIELLNRYLSSLVDFYRYVPSLIT